MCAHLLNDRQEKELHTNPILPTQRSRILLILSIKIVFLYPGIDALDQHLVFDSSGCPSPCRIILNIVFTNRFHMTTESLPLWPWPWHRDFWKAKPGTAVIHWIHALFCFTDGGYDFRFNTSIHHPTKGRYSTVSAVGAFCVNSYWVLLLMSLFYGIRSNYRRHIILGLPVRPIVPQFLYLRPQNINIGCEVLQCSFIPWVKHCLLINGAVINLYPKMVIHDKLLLTLVQNC